MGNQRRVWERAMGPHRVLMLCGPLMMFVAVAEPAEHDDNPVEPPSSDATPSASWLGPLWLSQPESNIPRPDLTLPPPSEQEEMTTKLERQLEEAHVEAEAAQKEANRTRDEAARTPYGFDLAPLMRRLVTPQPTGPASEAPSGQTHEPSRRKTDE